MGKISKKILFSRDAIQKRVRELAYQISKDYAGRELIIIGVLKGAFILMADLIREMSIPCKVDFAGLASYGAGSESSGKVVMTKDIETSIKEKDILVVEDILDTGLTMQYFVDRLKERNPKSLKTCIFLVKRKKRKVNFKADYVGFNIDNCFVVGYGLDFNEKYRFLPHIYVIKK
ncbi:MAG: hypoxanthine phosphoribosyltransferase [Syntrophaceae bacterium]|nr:hypoxanthine phosphoribosyltransferase [Syntrophaceae bacterium]